MWLILKLVALEVSEIFQKKHFVTAEAAAANIDDSIMRNAYASVSHKKLSSFYCWPTNRLLLSGLSHRIGI